jgi:competence protein ComEC
MEAKSSISGQLSAGQGDAFQLPAPLFHAAWQFAVGITVAHWVWLPPTFVLTALAPVALLCAIASVRVQRLAWLPLATLWILLGGWCALMQPQPTPAAQLSALSDGLLRTVEGTIVQSGTIRNEAELSLNETGPEAMPSANELQTGHRTSQSFDLNVSSLEVVNDTEDAQLPIAGHIRLTVRWPVGASPAPFPCGERIRVIARLREPEIYHDPGVWSREDYLVDQGITSSATVDVERVESLGPSGNARTLLACRIGMLQHTTTERILSLPAAMRGLPPSLRLTSDDAIMLAAMVAGDRTYLSHSLRVGFERTGSFHMLVVSGFHLAIVAGCLFWVTRRIRIPRVPATLLTIAATFAYAFFTGIATPVQRSVWMVTLYLVGRLVYRDRSPLNTIGFASLCLLVVNPRSLFDSSLQMTLLAVVAIAGIAAPLLEGTIHPYVNVARNIRLKAIDSKLSPLLAQFRETMRLAAAPVQLAGHAGFAWRIFPWIVRSLLRLVELLVVSIVVELAMTLPMAIYFHRITIVALPVNVLILPLLLVLMPAALLTLLALFVWPSAAVLPAVVVAVVLHFSVWLVHLFGSLTYGDFRIPGPLLWQSLAFCALLASAMLLAHRSLNTLSRAQRRLAWLTLLFAALAAVAPRPIDHPKNALLVEAIDVGQGDSLLLISPDGKTLLVDGGGFGGGPRQSSQDFDIGEEVVSPVLWARGIRHLDAVALTHAHSDHMGGLPAVVRNFHPDELWVGNNPHAKDYLALLDEAAALHVSVHQFHAGDTVALGSAQFNVLAPVAGYEPGVEPSNNDSLVLHASFGGSSVLLEGDAEAPIEEAMLAAPSLSSTLLKVGHHGSLTSTRPEFLVRVAPQWAVISCGLHNRYGHPRLQVLEELQEAHVRTFRTDLGGATCFDLNGKIVAPEPACSTSQIP